MTPAPAIAIVGMACRYPDARDPGELWECVLAQRSAFRRIPAVRLRLEDYWSDDRGTPDAIYSAEAAVIEGWEFDRQRFRVAGTTYRAADLSHWLALDVASRALEDAGFADGVGLDRTTTGVIIGNTLTGEFSRAGTLRLRWPYVRRVVESELAAAGMAEAERAALLNRMEAVYKKPFAPVGEETLAGGLSNTIAGRICNHYDWKGGGYTVDGACAASLLSVITACQALEARDLDVALAGGVDLSLDPFELVGFAKAGALAAEEMRVYDARAQGFWPGEGCGFVVLMREDEARARGLCPYAVIRGWGISSDGGGGITRPEVDGQMLALARAYARAGVGADTIGYFEGHGTGTAIGDATELEVLSRTRRSFAPAPPAALGSIKANIGHTKAAAGIAGLLKATLALHHQVLPPTTGCEQPHAELARPDAALRVLAEAAAWPEAQPLRAAVSAMGFGGINTHVVLEGRGERRPAPAAPRRVTGPRQDAELFLFAASDRAGLTRQVERVRAHAANLSRAELADVAAALAGALSTGRARAAVLAAKPAELERSLATLAAWLAEDVLERIDTESGVFLGGEGRPRIAFLFSGQGSPVPRSGGALARRFEGARAWFDRAGLLDAGDTVATAVAQPAIVACSLAGLAALDTLGIGAQVAVGHSLGEITALHWAGAFDGATLHDIARARGRAMMDTPGPPSGMLGIAAGADDVAGVLEGLPVVIAGLNLPRQTVVSGESEALATVESRARERGWRAVRLPVSHAFHSPLMAPAAVPLGERLRRAAFAPLTRTVCSTVTGGVLPAGEDVAGLLERQLTSPVRFLDAFRALGEVNLAIEVGPGGVIAGLARELLAGPVVTIDAGGASLRGLLTAAGAAYALGADVRTAALFGDRFARPFDLDRPLRFLENPCEQAPLPQHATGTPAAPPRGAATPEPAHASQPSRNGAAVDVLERVRRAVAERTELPLDTVLPAHRLLDDLHLNSISVGQMVAGVARDLGLAPSASPTEYADATVAEVARALEERLRTGGSEPAPAEGVPAGIESWIRVFTVARAARPRPSLPKPSADAGPGEWTILAAPDDPLRAALAERLRAIPGRGVAVCLPAAPGADAARLLLDGARHALATTPRARFVVIQQDGGGGGFARSFHLESPHGTTCVIEVPLADPRAADWVAGEAAAADGYHEARFAADGTRSEPVLVALAPAADGAPPLGPGDVVLVTGGGKGIAAECALALARECGCRLALLGRSDPATDAELARNLERVRAAGVTHCYRAADVTDADAVRAAVREAEAALGPVTAVIHGAGVNTPELVRSLEHEALARTVAVKVGGARNVLAALDEQRLRLFVAFGSIIARSGLRGEADYALANEWLTRLTEELALRAPGCRAISIEWSVWSGVGMGERLGRVEALASQGVTPIGPDQGLAIFRHLIGVPLPVTAVVVSGRIGTLPTLRVEPAELPLLRFLERPRVHYPGIELVADAELTPGTDPYLDDHVFGGVRLFPAVMGLEAMAQAAVALTGATRPPVFENVRFERPVAISEAGTTLRIAALVRAPGVVDVALRSAETGFEVDHFRATCRTGTEAWAPESAVAGADRVAADVPLLPLDPARDLYGGILFHRGRFCRVGGYRALRATSCVAEIVPAGDTEWFGRYLPSTLVLGDPAARDGAIHAVQACIPHATILPVAVARVWLDPEPGMGARTVDARETAREGQELLYDLEVRDSAGQLRERWDGLRLRIVGEAPHAGPWPAPLLATYVERRVAELLSRGPTAVSVIDSNGASRNERSDAAIRSALGRPAIVRRRPDGRPEVEGGAAAVSTAHAGPVTLAVSGAGPLGCDLEAVVARTASEWRLLLGEERWSLAGSIAREADEPVDVAATRVWCALECAKKAGAPLESLRRGAIAPHGWVVIEAGRLAIATLAAGIRGIEGPVVVAILPSPGCPPCAPTNTVTWSPSRKRTSSETSTT